MAGAAAGLDPDHMAMWRALVAGIYFAIPVRQCQTCGNPNEVCGRFFCTQCRLDNVCEAAFLDGGPHAHHEGIRVWKVTHQFSVHIQDVRRWMPVHNAEQMQRYWQNNRQNVKLVKPEVQARNTVRALHRRLCHSCGEVISYSTIPNHSPHPVCSLKCVLDFIDAGAGVSGPRAVAVRPVALPSPLPRPVLMPALIVPVVARPLLIQAGGEAEERGPVGDHVQRTRAARRHRRKPNRESVRRAPSQ